MFRRAPDSIRTPEPHALARLALATGLFVVTAALGLTLPSSPAQAQISCQASGALPMFITPSSGIERDDIVDIPVRILNTSSTNPPNPADRMNVSARLGDTVTVELGCLDSGCNNVQIGSFEFVECVDFDPLQVASCTFTAPNQVVVQMTASGVPLTPGGFADFVTVRTRALLPIAVPDGVFFTKAQSSNQAIVTTDPLMCDPAVRGEAGGSVTAVFPEQPFVTIDKECTACDQTVPPSPPSFTSEVTITVNNTGPDTAFNCRVTDTYDPGGPDEQIILDETILELPSMGQMVYNVTTPSHLVDVDNQAEIVCEARPAPAQTTDTSSDICECTPQPPEVQITKTCTDCSPVDLTSEVMITVQNLSQTTPALGCEVTDTFDGQQIFAMTIDRLDPGETVDFPVFDTPGHETPVINFAEVNCQEFITGQPVSDTTSAECGCDLQPDIAVIKDCATCDPTSYESAVSITVSNNGNFRATNCQVMDTTLGVGISEVIPILEANTSQMFNGTTDPLPDSATNTVTVVCDEFPAGVEHEAMFSDLCECPFNPDVTIDKVCGVCNPVTRLSPVTVTAANIGDGQAFQCQITDVVNGVTEFDMTIDLPPNSGDQEFTFDVGPLPDDGLINTAEIQCADIPAGGGGTKFAVSTDACECPRLFPFVTIEKICEDCNPNTSPPYQSQVSITASNSGTGPATGCQIIDRFNGSIAFQDNIDLAAGETRNFMFNTAAFSSTTLNTVEINCDASPEPEAQTSDTAEDSCVCELPRVRISKLCTACDPQSDPPNQSQVTVTVNNDGPGAATGCQVVDNFPGSPPLINESIPNFPGSGPGSQEIFNATTPPHATTVVNEAEITCDFLPPPAITSAATSDPCECAPPPFVPPCSGVECEICFPDDLKQERINPF